MSKNSVKRTVIHSDELHRMICDGVLNDYAVLEKKSVSMVIEDLIMRNFLPRNHRAMQETALMYYPDDVRRSISQVLSCTFDYYAAGTDWNAAHDNGLDLILYTSTFIANTPDFTVKRDPYLDSKLDSIASKLEDTSEKNIVKSLAGQDIDKYAARQLIDIIIDNWAMLGTWTITYRMLCVLMRNVQNHNDTPWERVELISVIDRLSEVWN